MTASDRPFQTWAAATGKARLPTVDSLMGGMTRRLVLADRKARRPGRSATVTRGPRYRGALSCRTLYVSTTILYCTRFGTRSQCSVVNASVMCLQWCVIDNITHCVIMVFAFSTMTLLAWQWERHVGNSCKNLPFFPNYSPKILTLTSSGETTHWTSSFQNPPALRNHSEV